MGAGISSFLTIANSTLLKTEMRPVRSRLVRYFTEPKAGEGGWSMRKKQKKTGSVKRAKGKEFFFRAAIALRLPMNMGVVEGERPPSPRPSPPGEGESFAVPGEFRGSAILK